MSTQKSLEQTLTDRGGAYGDFGQMAVLAQSLKNQLVTVHMSAVQREAMQLICTKLARIACGNPNHADSWRDISGYAELVVKFLAQEKVPFKVETLTGSRPADHPGEMDYDPRRKPLSHREGY